MAAAAPSRTALTVDGRVTTYAYAPDSNRLTAVDDGTGPVSFAYDAAGNTLTDGTRQFAYDARNRMATADGHAYGYNALGQRAFKPRFQTAAPGDADGDGVIDENDLKSLRDMIKGTIPASPGADCNSDGAVDNKDTNCIACQIGAAKNRGKGKTSEPEISTVTTTATDGGFTQVGWVLFAYDAAGHLIGEYDEAGDPIRRYVWLEDLPVAVISVEGIHYLHADHLNTPKVVTDPQGAIVWQVDYQPFGGVTETTDTFELNLRFPGQYHDRETGLHQNWHREYVPELGRYSQSDPIGLRGGINTYPYALNGPILLYGSNGNAPRRRIGDPDVTAICGYYRSACMAAGGTCNYHCNTAPLICANPDLIPTTWIGVSRDEIHCIRICLIREDKSAWKSQKANNCEPKCIKDAVIDQYHRKCYTKCGVATWRFPGVGSFGNDP